MCEANQWLANIDRDLCLNVSERGKAPVAVDGQTRGVQVTRPIAKYSVEAAKSVVMLDLALLSPEIADGLYKKPIQTIAREIHYEPPPEEIRAVIISAWSRGGLLPNAAIERNGAGSGSFCYGMRIADDRHRINHDC
jgi:hypothetical protein